MMPMPPPFRRCLSGARVDGPAHNVIRRAQELEAVLKSGFQDHPPSLQERGGGTSLVPFGEGRGDDASLHLRGGLTIRRTLQSRRPMDYGSGGREGGREGGLGGGRAVFLEWERTGPVRKKRGTPEKGEGGRAAHRSGERHRRQVEPRAGEGACTRRRQGWHIKRGLRLSAIGGRGLRVCLHRCMAFSRPLYPAGRPVVGPRFTHHTHIPPCTLRRPPAQGQEGIHASFYIPPWRGA